MRAGSRRRPPGRRTPTTPICRLICSRRSSNGYRARAWKAELQHLANRLDLSIHVSHFPPGTSKWNKIEHRMFSFITMNWRGKPLRTFKIVVSLIGNTTTRGGLVVVHAALDQRKYPTGKKVSKKEMSELNIERDKFHSDWNYVIRPHAKNK